MLYTEFQCPSMPRSCQKVCGAVGGAVRWVVCKPILVFSFFQAKQFHAVMTFHLNP